MSNKSEVIGFGVTSNRYAACNESGSRFYLLPTCILPKGGFLPLIFSHDRSIRLHDVDDGRRYRSCCNCFRNLICIQFQRDA